MKAILDTHVFLWWNMDDPRLSDSIREIIAGGRNELFLSAASAWEIAIKAGRGRLSLPVQPQKYVADRLVLHGFQPLPITLSHALQVSVLPEHHRNPFDRLLVAQGQLEDMPILTADPMIARYDVNTIF
jgi:PIN domain nuclease of toxin-antitoxin system